LRAAFTGPFLEGQTNTYRLGYVNPSVFRLLVQWLYPQKIDLHIEIDSVLESAENVDENGVCDREKTEAVDGAADAGTNDDGCDKASEAWRAQDLEYAQLWVAGDKLLMSHLQNAVWISSPSFLHSNIPTSGGAFIFPFPCQVILTRSFTSYVCMGYGVKQCHRQEFPHEMLFDFDACLQ
jgi:hypothetical protein